MATIARTKTSNDKPDAETDMSSEAQEYKKVLDIFFLLVGGASMWDYLLALRWFDVRKKLLAAVDRRDAFLQKLIDAERRRVDVDGEEGEKQSMISVLLSLQQKDPKFYTDIMIMSLCGVSAFIPQ